MHNILTVAVIERLQDLPEDLRSHLLAEVFLLDDAIKKFTASAKSKN